MEEKTPDVVIPVSETIPHNQAKKEKPQKREAIDKIYSRMAKRRKVL